MNVNDMTRKEFEALPFRGKFDAPIFCDSIIILPGRSGDKHDSGYRCMDFVAVNGDEPICLLSGCSDVVHIEGIGGYGHNWFTTYKTVPDTVTPRAWSIDCLPKSGLLRIFCNNRKINVGAALSSFEITSVK